MPILPKDNYELAVGRDAIKQSIVKVSKEINDWHKESGIATNSDKPVIALCMLNGGMFFFAELLFLLEFSPQTEFLKITSYDINTNSKLSEDQGICVDLNFDPRGSTVLVIDDICDTGSTLDAVINQLHKAGASIVKSVVLIDRAHLFPSPVKPDFSALKIDTTEWLVGMGLDDQNIYRNLDQIYKIKK